MAGIPDLTFDAGLSANVDAEKTILGTILLDNAAHAEAAEKLESDDFSLDSHRRIFLRMSELMDAKHAVDIVTLANELVLIDTRPHTMLLPSRRSSDLFPSDGTVPDHGTG
jgi:replicative DNA helicase